MPTRSLAGKSLPASLSAAGPARGALLALLAATALTPARGADMTMERALNPQREPQN